MIAKIRNLLAVGLLAGIVTQPAHAAPSQCDGVVGNLVTNCGFEAGPTVTGWTLGGTYGVALGLNFYERTGTRAGIMNFDNDGAATLSQSIGAAGSYDVSFWLAMTDSGLSSMPSPLVSVWFGDQQLSVTTPTRTATYPMNYVQYVFTDVTVGGPAVLRFESAASAGIAQYANLFIDDVIVTARSVGTVPVPGALALLGIGLAGLGVSSRRKAH